MKNETLNHLAIFRKHVLYAVSGYLLLAVACAIAAKPLFNAFATPIINLLPEQSLIATQVAAPFIIPLKFSLLFSLGLALPWVLYQLWQFIAPGLFQSEKKWMFGSLAISMLLFYTGIAFAYYLVMPLALNFFIGSAPTGVVVMTDMSAYLNFALKLLFAFALAFQTPLIVVILTRLNIVKVETLKQQRGYVIIGAFALGMLLTPPDVLSQTLLAIPLWLLFELGLLLSRR